MLAFLWWMTILPDIEILEKTMTHLNTNNLANQTSIRTGLSILSPKNRCACALLCVDFTRQIDEQDFNYNGMT